MRRTEKGVPTLSWCMIVRNAEATLETTLKSIRERTPQAEIVIVDTMSRDRSPEIAKKYADVWHEWRGPNGDWDRDMPWFTDAAAARQLSFELASGRWRGWIDSDDRLPGPEEAEKLLKLNARWKPQGGRVEEADAKPIYLDDLLKLVEERLPTADCIWAPYLYAKDEHGQAYVWQERERIVKWSEPAKWRWAEKAHEILVPVEGYTPAAKVNFSHLLFIHERKFDDKSTLYSTQRHFDVLHKQYASGDRTTRRCLYLAAYALTLCPEREREFIDAAHECAVTSVDRYRSLSALGQLYVRQGLLTDALEAFGAAVHLRPDIPDVWFLGAESWIKAGDFIRAADWLEKGIACPVGQVDSFVNPRFHVIRYPTLLSEVYLSIGKEAKEGGLHEQSQAYYGKAVEMMTRVRQSPAIGEDWKEAEIRRMKAHNDYLAQGNAIVLKRLCDYLIQNDEPKKALEILERAPWNLQDHPLILEMQKKLAPVARHIVDPKAYRDFYNTDTETGYVQSPESWLDPENGLARVRWIGDWLNRHLPKAVVLDVGCFDGIVGIPLLKMCKEIKYVGVDVYKKPIATLTERAKKCGFFDRVHAFALDSIADFPSVYSDKADVIIWSEVIEHVPDPVAELKRILVHLKPNGYLFITTPWGSFDAGHPPDKTELGTPRDSRGHLRVLTARDIVKVLDAADVEIEDLFRLEVPISSVGDGLHVVALNRSIPKTAPVNLVVPGALWDWNGRTVEQKGMGASEKSIVQIASALAQDYRRVEVFGPVPNEDVYRGVRYWPKSHLRYVTEGKVVVSRSPGFAPKVDELIGRKHPKILWLQDAWYPDLTKASAENYETIVVVSEWHKQAMHERHGVPLEKFTVLYNPVDARFYQKKLERKRDRFVYCSSPDRGLIPLLKMWPRILEKLPEATLEIFYGWRGCEKLGINGEASWVQRYETARRAFEKLRYQKGVFVHDMVDPTTLADAFLSSGVWAYPVTNFHETCCTSALEARAAGCVPVCPPLAALSETARCAQSFLTPLPEHPDFEKTFIDYCVMAARTTDVDREKMAKDALEQYRIEAFLPKWKEILA